MHNIPWNEIPIPKAGELKARAAAARAKVAEAKAKRLEPANILKEEARHHGKVERELQDKVEKSQKHHAMLVSKLASTKNTLDRLEEETYLTGETKDGTYRMKDDLATLPRLIERASREIQDASDRLEAHRAATPGRHVEVEPQADEDDVTDDSDDVHTAPRRGRPPKVAA